MRHWKRLAYYLLINVLVSTCTVVAVLSIWERIHPLSSPARMTLTGTPPTTLLGFHPGNPSGTPNPVEITPQATTPITPSEIQPEEPAAGDLEYIVQAGDTLGSIAQRFDLTVAEIMEANELTDPDRLDVGQVLIIPGKRNEPASSPTLPPAEPTSTSLPVPSLTPTPAGEARVAIVSAFGVGDLDSERLRLERSGPGELSLSGWLIEDEDGNVFTFPQLILFAGGAIDLYTKPGQATAVALYWGLNRAVWSPGEQVTLRDDQGQVHATYLIP